MKKLLAVIALALLVVSCSKTEAPATDENTETPTDEGVNVDVELDGNL